MADIIFVAITIAFFALCVVYVNWCDRIIGVEDIVSASTVEPDDQPAQPLDRADRDNQECSA